MTGSTSPDREPGWCLIEWLRLVYWCATLTLGALTAYAAFNPDRPVAKGTLLTNHKLTGDDLGTSEIAAMRGRYLIKAAPAGTPVTIDMTSELPVMPIIMPGTAVVVDIAKRDIDSLKLSTGETVQLISVGRNLGEPGTVLAISCDEFRCAVIVSVAKPQTLDPQSLARVTLKRVEPPPVQVIQ